jgi:peptidoglycan/xylan/chitin deacetylase (PgdA/CDA1 family)
MIAQRVANGHSGNRRLADAVLTALSSFPLAKLASSRDPIVLLYHGIPRRSSNGEVDCGIFEEHVRFLTSRFDVVGTECDTPRKRRDKQRVILTFDDGFRNNAEVAAPILRRYRAPAAFFVCSRHATEGSFLWVSYIDALSRFYRWPDLVFRGDRYDMRSPRRRDSVEALRAVLRAEAPHPAGAYNAILNELPALSDFVSADDFADRYAGMTSEQVGELAADPLFEIGSHTVDHPFLADCEDQELNTQIAASLASIQAVTGVTCRTIAYPSGSYDDRVLEVCTRFGLRAGFAVTPHLGRDQRLEIPRLGIYTASEAILRFKVQWGNHLRAARIAVG